MTEYLNGRLRISCGDSRERLLEVPKCSVDLIVTSPPYWGLRDYDSNPLVWGGDPNCHHEWGNEQPGNSRGGSGTPTDKNGRGEGYARLTHRGRFCIKCDAWSGQLGLEPSPKLFVEHLVSVFQGCHRVLKDTGLLFLVIGDTYCGYHGNKNKADNLALSNKPGYIENMRGSNIGCDGLKNKDLVGIPWLTAFALRNAGWYLRCDNIWSKPNCLPGSQRDRPTRNHEYVFMFSKSSRYFYDDVAIMEPTICNRKRGPALHPSLDTNGNDGLCRRPVSGMRTKRAVWEIPTQPSRFKHYAAFPKELVKICVLSGSSEKGCCVSCGVPYFRVVDRKRCFDGHSQDKLGSWIKSDLKTIETAQGVSHSRFTQQNITLEWTRLCKCETSDVVPSVVLDPFGGTGTVAEVALSLGRNAILIDSQPEYIPMMLQRCGVYE